MFQQSKSLKIVQNSKKNFFEKSRVIFCFPLLLHKFSECWNKLFSKWDSQKCITVELLEFSKKRFWKKKWKKFCNLIIFHVFPSKVGIRTRLLLLNLALNPIEKCFPAYNGVSVVLILHFMIYICAIWRDLTRFDAIWRNIFCCLLNLSNTLKFKFSKMATKFSD